MNGIAFRIGELIEKTGLKSGSFAKRIGVSPSILSHVLHGRNKPSLDLILKIHSALPEVDLKWLLTGSGNQPEALIPKPEESNATRKSSSTSSDRIIILRSNGTFEEYVGK